MLGSPPTPEDQDEKNIQVLLASGARYMTYDTLIAETLDSYKDYLEKEQEAVRVSEVD